MDALVGKTLGRYRIEALIGQGGMALVYRAHDPAIDRPVAIKVVNPLLAADRQFVDRFLREARAAARLQHPHILPIHDFGEQDSVPYLVMPYITGGTLQERLGKPWSIAAALAVLGPIAVALDYAHRQGVIHRDVKPANILLTDEGVPLLADFGIARVLGDVELTSSHVQLGSIVYMAPEQVQGQPLDGRTDLYALGVILYEALTGRPPFDFGPTDTPFSVALRHVNSAPPSPRDCNPALSPAAEAVLLRALAKDPAARYPSGAALFDALGATPTARKLPRVHDAGDRPPPAGHRTSATRVTPRLPSAPAPVIDGGATSSPAQPFNRAR